MPSVEFDLKPDSSPIPATVSWRAALGLSDIVLERNARWFIKIRWVFAALLILFQVAILFADGLLTRIGIAAEGQLPVLIAGILVCSNILFTLFLLQPRLRSLVHPHANLWAQITVDLVCLTVFVHYCGSIATPAPFLYVLHIVLSCVFFPIKSSIIVTCMAIFLYMATVTAELVGVFEQYDLFIAVVRPVSVFSRSASIWWAAMLSLIFLAVWYLVSQLSLIIRTRESQLIDAQEQIRKAQDEKDRYAVQMTHQLKAPLDAIRSTIGLVMGGYSGAVSDQIRELLTTIDKRATGMAVLVMDVLKLARIRGTVSTGKREPLEIGAIIRSCIDVLRPVADKQHIRIDATVGDFFFTGARDQIEMLFENLISNAITYSRDNGTVSVAVTLDKKGSAAVVDITDHGIGIRADALPHIFDEYFRAPEAVRHNSASSGIGLAIVKTVVQNHNLLIRVRSEQDAGTTFSVVFHGITEATQTLPA